MGSAVGDPGDLRGSLFQGQCCGSAYCSVGATPWERFWKPDGLVQCSKVRPITESQVMTPTQLSSAQKIKTVGLLALMMRLVLLDNAI